MAMNSGVNRSQQSAADYIKQAQDFESKCQQTDSGLCCCEYLNKDRQRSHILACCCNCEEFDLVFDSWIRCKHVEASLSRGMLLTFQDRLRIPWRGGAKQVSLGTLVPIVAIPLAIAISAVNVYATCIMLVATCIFLRYVCYLLKRTRPRSKFLCMWLIWSVVNIIVLFEFTVPLLELLPEEKYVLVLLSAISIYCLWKVRQRAALNHVVQSTVDEDELPDITEAEEEGQQTALLIEQSDDVLDDERNHPSICQICRKYVQPRTNHCIVCQACIVMRDHHSYWLDCCIGEANHRYYLVGLLFAELALLLGSNLTLTAVCHPFLVVRLVGIPLMLPDDCSDVFEEYDLGIAFVIALYAIIMAAYVFFVLMKQCFLLSKGTTLYEYKRSLSSSRKTWLSTLKAFVF